METAKHIGITISTVMAALVMQSCSGTPNKKLDAKLSQENVTTNTELQHEASEVIEDAPNLTDDQKKQLISLKDNTRAELRNLSSESIQLRAILIKDVIDPKYNPREVGLIKKRLRGLEDKRLSVVFDAIDKSNLILGRQSPNYNKMMDNFFDDGNRSGLR